MNREREITSSDRFMAKVCMNCTVCKRAREKQQGAAFWFVSKIESDLYPFCRAYERVYGRKAHESVR